MISRIQNILFDCSRSVLLIFLILAAKVFLISGCSKATTGIQGQGNSHSGEIPQIPEEGDGHGALDFPKAYFSDGVKVKAGQPSLVIINKLIDLVNGAQKGSDIYLNIYQIDYEPLVNALVDASDRGVYLHLMIDCSKESSLKKNGAALKTFRKLIKMPGELVVIDNDNGASAINHHKHMLFSAVKIGGQLVHNIVFTTSENFTKRELTVLEDAVVFSDVGLYSAFVDNWNKMAGLSSSGMKAFVFNTYTTTDQMVKAHFFPAREGGVWNGKYLVADLLDSLDGSFSKDTVLVAMDQWSDGQLDILNKLIALDGKGAKIEIIVRNENSKGLGTAFLTKLHEFKEKGGNVLILPDDQIVHSKYMLIKAVIGGKSRRMILGGTLNYSNPATQHNNNLLLKMEYPSLVKAYVDNFKLIQKIYKD